MQWFGPDEGATSPLAEMTATPTLEGAVAAVVGGGGGGYAGATHGCSASCCGWGPHRSVRRLLGDWAGRRERRQSRRRPLLGDASGCALYRHRPALQQSDLVVVVGAPFERMRDVAMSVGPTRTAHCRASTSPADCYRNSSPLSSTATAVSAASCCALLEGLRVTPPSAEGVARPFHSHSLRLVWFLDCSCCCCCCCSPQRDGRDLL